MVFTNIGMKLQKCGGRTVIAVAALVVPAACGAPQSTPAISPIPMSLRAGPAAEHTGPANFRVLYTFKGGLDGWYPTSSLIAVNGTLYGTTAKGGGGLCNCGTVFSISSAGVETVLHGFGESNDGATPYAQLLNLNGTLYGTTLAGGEYGNGTVFSISTSGKERVLHSFNPALGDGSEPQGGLVSVKGVLYGTTYTGGGAGSVCHPYGCGTVFSITTKGKERVIHRFPAESAPDGELPEAGLLKLGDVLYGTTDEGDYGRGRGTVFRITTSGSEKIVYAFEGLPNASAPQAALTNVNGTLFGTTSEGGTNTGFCGTGCGTVYSLSQSGVETVLHSFGGSGDGFYPEAALINVNGTLYGTTSEGGTLTHECGDGCGTVFSISQSGTERVIHRFSGGSQGWYILSGLIYLNGTLYGTAAYGGVGAGIVFAVTP